MTLLPPNSNTWVVRARANNLSNIYKIAKDVYPMMMVGKDTDWVAECHNYKAEIIKALEEKYPSLFGDMDYDSCIRVTHRKDFDTLEYLFNGPFIKRVEEFFPEALI